MATNTLKKITIRAKQLRKKRPGISWKSAVKSAGLEYRQGKIGKTRKTRRIAPKKKKTTKRKRMGSDGQVTRSKTHTDYNRNKVNIAVGGTASGHMGAAKKILLEDIGRKEAQKFAAKKKSVKNKIQKTVSELKRRYNRLAC